MRCRTEEVGERAKDGRHYCLEAGPRIVRDYGRVVQVEELLDLNGANRSDRLQQHGACKPCDWEPTYAYFSL